MPLPPRVAADQLESLILVLDLVRSGRASTRPELVRVSGLGRNVVSQRVEQLLACGLATEDSFGPSTGGRAPRRLGFRADAGHILVAELGATSISVGVSDLAGAISGYREEPADITAGPEAILGRVDELFRALLAEHGEGVTVWGTGIGLPGPVEFRSGRPIAPPIMPGWDGFSVRRYFVDRYGVPVWVDNEVNLMALGEFRAGMAGGEEDFVYVKVGTGIGAGLVSGGRLHRGAQGCAGDIGHIAIVADTNLVCRCGKLGCLEAFAGGAALARDGEMAARARRSPFLARVLDRGDAVTAVQVGAGAVHGDPISVGLLTESAERVGEALARLVNFFNPSLILIGGGVAQTGDMYLANVRRTVLTRSLPLATRDLRIARSPLADQAGLMGAAFMVIDELLSNRLFGSWIDRGSPAGMEQLTA